MGVSTSVLQLRCGHGVEVKEEDPHSKHGYRRRPYLVSSVLEPQCQDDGATHVLECMESHACLRAKVNENSRMVSFLFDEMPGAEQWSPHEPYECLGTCMPALPQHTEHRCTDRHGLVLLLLTLCVIARAAHYGWTEGSLARLSTAYDYNGKICGVDDTVEDKPYLFWCLHETDKTRIALHHPICVESCPTSDTTSNRCPVSRKGANTTAEHLQHDYSTRNFGLSPFCWPTEKHFRRQVAQARSQKVEKSNDGWLRGLLLVPPHAWVVFPITCVTASLMGYLYFRMLQKCVDYIVLAFILAATNLTVVVGLWNLYTQYPEPTIHGVCLGLTLLIIGAFFIKWLSNDDAQNAINAAAGCIEAACECINQEFSLLIEPIIALVIRITVLMTLAVIMVLVVTTGSPHRTKGQTVTRYWEFDAHEAFYCAFVGFTMIWFMEMGTSLSQYVLAWVAERWYFTPYVNDKKLDWERNAVLKGYANAIRYHLGSIAWGSLLICLLRPLRMCLAVFDLLATKFCPRHEPRYLRCCRHINKNAYLLLALTSDSFSACAMAAEHMSKRDTFAATSYVNSMQGVFQLGGLIAISCAAGCGTLLIFHICPFFVAELKAREVMTMLTMACSVPIGISYMTLFDTVGDTILFCWSVQQTRYRYHLRHRYSQQLEVAATGLLSTATVGMYSLVFGESSGEGQADAVNYAPMALRELLLGRSRRIIRFPWSSCV